MKLLILVGVLFVGCTTIYVKPGQLISETQLEHDTYACTQDRAMVPYAPQYPLYPTAQLPAPQYRTFDGRYISGVNPTWGYDALAQGLANLGQALGEIAQRNDLFEQCMKSKGYQKEQ